MIEAGKLTDKVNILRRVLSKDKWGSEAIKYIKELTTRANVLVENGQMTERANEIYYTYNISVLCRKLRVAEYDVVQWREDYYQVQSIVPTRERDGQYIKAIKIDSTLVIPALVRKYNVKFYTYNGGVDYLYAETETADDGTFTFPVPPSQVGYQFSGWFTLPDGEGVVVEEGFVANQDIKLYAYMEVVRDEAEDILRHMPSSIRSALVAWFSPYYQHVTNEELQKHPYLIDLCGSNLSLQARNFAYTSTSGVRGSGLVFDGVNDRLYTSYNISSQTAGISLFVRANSVQRSRFIIEQRQSTTVGTGAWTYLLELPTVSGANNRNSSEVFYVEGKRGTSFDAMPHFDSLDPFRMHMLNEAPIQYANNLSVGSTGGNANYASMTLYGLIIWNRLLSANEVAWVERSMMKDHREEAQADE